MFAETTVPTKVSKKQYKSGKFAINCENGDHWLLIADKDPIWVGRDEGSRDESTEFPVEEICVTDEHGQDEWVNAYVFPTSESCNDLDLEELEEGKIEWR